MSMRRLIEMSNRYGSDEEYVLLGGGNTSFKENGVMRVKGSGCALASVVEQDFIPMKTAMLLDMLKRPYPADDDAREAEVLANMMSAKLAYAGADESKRPSVESILHAIFPRKFGLHLHPPLVNGLSCSKEGERWCADVLGSSVAWAKRAKPGYLLSMACYDSFRQFSAKHGYAPQVMVLQNHGIFVSADTVEEIDSLLADVMDKLRAGIQREPLFAVVPQPPESSQYGSLFRELYTRECGVCEAVFCTNSQALSFAGDAKAMMPLMLSFTPDHVVYCKGGPLYVQKDEDPSEAFNRFLGDEGYAPKIVVVQDMGFFALGNTIKEAENARLLFLDAMKIAVYAESFGGSVTLTRDIIHFMVYWEFEKYRLKVDEND